MSRTKGCISLLLVLCLMIGHLSPITLAIENHVVEGEMAAESSMDLSILSDQVMTGSCGEALTWTLSDDGVLTISGTGEMTDYTDGMPAPWNDHWHQIESVVIGDGVTSIGDQAFSGLSYLMEVEIGDDVEVIGYKAFYNCEIFDLQLGKRLRVIEDHAFQNTGLFDLRVPDSVTTIGDYAFAGCRNLHSLDIYKADVTIGEGAFSSCNGLEYVSIGMGRVTIGDRVFSGCTGITEIFFGENVIEIGSFAFENCDSIQRIHFSGAAPNFGEQVFKNVTAVVIYPQNDDSWMECISQEYGGNLTWLVYVNCWEEGHVYEAVVTEPTCEEDGFTTYTCFYCGDYYTDDYVQSLGHNFVDGVCTNCSLVLKIVAEGQTDQGLVWKLDNLGILTISGSGYMYGFSKAEQAPWYAYQNKIRMLVIENGVLSIGYNAFYHYIYLEKVKIASSVGSIGSQAFYSCRYLRDIVFEGSPPAIEWNSFYDVKASATYPSDGGWTNDNLQDYGGKITWVEKQICDPAEHAYEAVVTEPSCAKIGYTTHICTICDRSYVEAYTNALGHRFENGECTICGITESIVAEGACGEDLVWKLTDDGLLDISGTGEMTDVPWETYKDRIICAVIHDGVTSVAKKAFNDCAVLESVAIPDSVTEFSASFDRCTNLRFAIFPDSVVTCTVFFQDCTNLEYVELPLGITRIGSWAFSGCRKLKSIDIPDTVTIIKSNAFHECGIQEICIPEGVHTIEEYAFFDCYKAEKITIPNTVTTIGEDAFAWNWKVPEIHIPASVTNIGDNAFMGCAELRKVVIAGDEVTLGEGIFKECTALEEIRFEGVRPVFLSYDVFGDCDATVYFHGRDCIWQEMINHDFGNATLTWVNLDDELAEHDLVKYEYKEPTCTESGYEAYGVCTVCEQIVPGYVELPAYGHHHRESYYIDPACEEFGGWVMVCEDCDDSYFQPYEPPLGHKFEAVVTEPTCTEAGYTTYTCSVCGSSHVADETEALGHSYESVVVKEATLLEKGELTHTCSVCGYSYTEVVPAYLKYKVYENYVEITKYTGNDIELVIPAEIEGRPVTCIGANAFSDCSSLQKIVIPDGITSIGHSAFAFCRNLADIAIPESVTSIGTQAFFECSALTSISLPSGIDTIGASTFAMCGNLAEIAIPHGVTSIGDFAFSRCNSLNSISIPDSVTSIGHYAFENCTSLGSVNFDGDAPKFGEKVFYRVVATADYPAGNPNWNAVMMKDHGGTITWVAQSHEYTAVVTAPTCTEGGDTTYTCSICGKSYVADRKEALGHNYHVVEENDEQIYTCKICGDSYVEGKKDDFYYTVYEDHVEIKGCDDSAMYVVIPAEIKGLPVTHISDGAFRQCTYLDRIVIPDSVTYIGDGAFRQCSYLREIVIPDSVTYIGDYAFYGCQDLTSIFLPSGITFIGRYTFANCSDLERIYIPASVTAIRESAFRGCRGLDTIVFDGDVPDFGENVFYGVKATAYYPSKNIDWSEDVLQNYGGTITWEPQVHEYAVVVIAPTCTERGYTTYTCSICGDSYVINEIEYLDHEFTAVVTAPTCTEGGYTTYTCSRCGRSYVADKTAAIGQHDYESVAAEDGSLIYTCKNCGDSYIEMVSTGARYKIHTDHLELTGYIDKNTELVIPNEIQGLPVTEIGNSAFLGCKILLSVVIPDSVTSIGGAAFQNCKNLISIDLPDSVTSIGSYAFYGCSGMTSIDLPDGVTVIGDSAFSGCSGLTSVNIPDGVTIIGDSAFSGCSGLTSIDIPDSITAIGGSAFSGCSSLTSVSIPDSVTSVGAYSFFGCDSLTGIYVDVNNSNYSSDDRGVLFNKAKTRLIQAPGAIAGSYVVPNGVTTIEERAFEDCTSMTHISLPDSVTVIGAYAFGNCSSLTGVALSDSLTSIGDSVFWHCSGLISINIPDSVTAIAHSAFYGCSSLTGINIPDGVTSIGSSAFYGCGSLTSVNIPDGVTVVNGYTFSGCSSLTSIDIPDSVISIGDYAFKECKNLTSVDLPSRLSTIGQQAFYKCSSLTSIDIPVGVISIGNSAFYKCTRLTVIGFNSDAPVFGSEVFTEVTATAYYPKEKHSWAEDVMKNYGGAITWEPFENTYDYMVFDDHVEITSYYGDDANVVIPTEIDGLPVTSIGNYAFADCSGVTSIEIADSVTVISELAFSGCDSLKSVYFNGDAPEIWLESFRGIAATVYYPTGNNTWTEYVEDDSITWMDYTPCQHEYSAVVTSATCAEQGYTTYTCSICENTYVIYCSKPLGHTYKFNTVKEVTGNENGETILTCKTCGYSATRIIPAYLQYVVYPDHVEIIGYIGKPTEVVIPAEIDGLPVTVIGDSAFYNCDEITTAFIPDSVTVIGASAFQDCSLLTSIVIPDSVTSIGVYAFQFCDRLNSVSLPKGITKIADHTFDYCWDLRSIDIPDSVTYIGDYAFYGSGLYSITIPHSITYIGKNVFEMCPSMMTIEFEEGVDSLESGVLSKCKELSSIHFKGDAPAFGQDSFEEVTAIAYYPASNPTWTADVLQDYGGTIAWVSYGNQKLSFTDVSEGAFFYDPVAWALDNGITNGTSATTFSPNDQCMRAHVVTFLWRAVGSPEPTRIDNPFVDVKPTDFYYKPVLWALENGITSGMDATHFGPTSYCNRAQVVTFLYRTLGSPVVESTSNPFTDVPAGQWYTAPVLWAVKNGITNGLSATSFGPNSICNRAQIVTFLYRAFVND